MKRLVKSFLVSGLVFSCLYFPGSVNAEEQVYSASKDTWVRDGMSGGADETLLVEFGVAPVNYYYRSYVYIQFQDLNLSEQVTGTPYIKT